MQDFTSTSATVATCDDGSKFGEKNQVTGHSDPQFNPKPSQAYLFEKWHMTRRSGHWAISAFTLATSADAAAAHCQP